MTLSRRHFLKRGSAALAALAAPARSFAEVTLGDMTVQTISDGSLTLSRDFIFEPLPADIRDSTVEAFSLTSETLQAPCNLTLLRQEGKVVLFDAGSGPGFQQTAGDITNTLDAIGVAPGDVTHLIFTHAHPDHLWGVLDDFDEPVFHAAKHMMGRVEFDYWIDSNTLHTIGESRQPFAVGAARRLEAIADRVLLFEDGEEVLSGISAFMTPGHTPGHMCFEVRSGNEALMILGDAISNHHVAMRHPSAPLGSDQDIWQAAETRVALLDRIAREVMQIVGFHLPHGGLGRVERNGEGFTFQPQV